MIDITLTMFVFETALRDVNQIAIAKKNRFLCDRKIFVVSRLLRLFVGDEVIEDAIR